MRIISFALAAVFICISSFAQIPKAPLKNEGDGPYTQLILRGVIMINGTGAPAMGPVPQSSITPSVIKQTKHIISSPQQSSLQALHY